ncbi:MAG: glycosyltransferase [Candidatus Moduliflexus flocculans]|nr:glycosyltransferase [Candidatus Moduliflexus flocculans]
MPPEKIDLIPHGIPDVPFVDPSFNKDLFGVEGKIVLLSFGLLSANKGIENVISALPAIVARYPDVVYIVVGATHPHVIKHEGETYRLSLQWLAQEKGVESHVIFYNRFVSLEELVEFIGAADIYITPYLNVQQITSGTLAYTVGAGKAVISTPYWYAEELLAEGRGALVPFRDPAALAGRGHRPAGQRGRAPRHAQAGLSARAGDDLAEGGASLHGELRARPRGTPALHARRASRPKRWTSIRGSCLRSSWITCAT